MTSEPLIVAAGINNELGSDEFSAVARLLKAGYPLEFLYYLPKIPAEFLTIPSFNQQLNSWREHGVAMLNEYSNKYKISKDQCHLIDEVLGPEKVFDDASKMHAALILTHDKMHLKKTWLSRLLDSVILLFSKQAKKAVAVVNVLDFVNQELGSNGPKISLQQQAINDEKIQQSGDKRRAIYKR